MARKKKHPEHVNHERWLVSYADFITLLFAFFVVMFAVSQVDSNKVGRFAESVRAVTLWNGPQLATPTRSSDQGVAPPSLIPTNVIVASKATGVDLRLMRDLLRQRLRAAIINSRITVEQDDEQLVVRLLETGAFAAGSARLLETSERDLQALGEVIHDLPYAVRIEGHTDAAAVRGVRYRSNWELSAARAVAVLECLARRGGVSESRMSVSGFAATRPIASNSTAAGRRRNRRVDIVLMELAPPLGLQAIMRSRAGIEDAAPGPPRPRPSPTDAWLTPQPVPAQSKSSH